MKDIVQDLQQEFRRGTLIMLTLSQLDKPAYGYNLVKKLNDNHIPMEANTLYPLLRRLEGQGLLCSQWDTTEAKPRKYYQITDEGRLVLEQVRAYWKEFSRTIDAMMEERQ